MHRPRGTPLLLLLGALALVLAWAGTARARLIAVTPDDDYRAIEAAQAGDTVEIAPGTYRFRVSLEHSGTADRPIVLRARDPAQRPVWDLGATPVADAPGSYQAGDRGRGCWQVRGGHYRIEGIVFRNCVDHGSSGVRVVNVPDVHIRDCLFQKNTNGVIGSGEDLRIEFCEFDHNGSALAGDAAAHSIYIYGGTLQVRFCYFHDSPRGQHFHVRSRDALLAYNWFTRPGSYSGDLMTCNYECGGAGTEAIAQRMLLLGNVIVQGTPANGSQLIALLKDEATSYDGTGSAGTLELTLLHNTIIGTSRGAGKQNSLVHLRNDTVATHLHASDNVALNFSAFGLAEAPGGGNYSVDGAGNWLSTGTADKGLDRTVFGADPGLSAGYVPQPGSPLIGAAADAAPAPEFEYYRDEKLSALGRTRAGARDIGAFESSTGSTPFGPEGPAGTGADLGPAGADLAGAPGADGGATGPGGSGSGCQAAAGTPTEATLALGLLLGVLLRRRKTRF